MILYLLDTNIVSYYIRRSSSVLEDRVSDALQRHNCAISTLTRAELRFGQTGMSADDKRHSLITGFLLRLPNLDWTPQAADHYAEIRAHLKNQGRPIGEIDTQIAAHALAENLVLVTHNTRHFERVPGLTMEDWML
jgi:tRNA(fMet)-specific endonuclease VapC